MKKIAIERLMSDMKRQKHITPPIFERLGITPENIFDFGERAGATMLSTIERAKAFESK